MVMTLITKPTISSLLNTEDLGAFYGGAKSYTFSRLSQIHSPKQRRDTGRRRGALELGGDLEDRKAFISCCRTDSPLLFAIGEARHPATASGLQQ